MQYISKKICLGGYKSYMPSTIPAFLDGVLYKFGSENNSEYNSNYGMYPVALDLVKIANEMGITIPLINGKDTYIVSYPTIAEWFHFFERYEHLLSNDSHVCTRSYSSIKELNEKTNSDYDEGMDDFYLNIGGEDMYSFFKEYIFPRFELPKKIEGNKEYDINAWGCDYLSFDSIKKWITYFQKANATNCCEETRYQLLGGEDMLGLLTEWLNGIYEKIDLIDTFLALDENEECISNISLPLLFNSRIDDLGEYSVFAEGWSCMLDYSNQNVLGYEYDSNTFEVTATTYEPNGALSIYNDMDYIINNDGKSIKELTDAEGNFNYDAYNSRDKGYIWNEKYKECYFGKYSALSEEEKDWALEDNADNESRNDWTRYFDTYLDKNLDEFLKCDSPTFAYKDNAMILNPTPLKMSTEIEFNEGLCYWEDNNIYTTTESDYIIYRHKGDEEDNKMNYQLEGKIFMVNYDTYNNPYVIIGGVQHYAIYDNKTQTYTFSFNAKDCLGSEYNCEILHGVVLDYHGEKFLVDQENKTVKLPYGKYLRLYDGWFFYDDGNDGLIVALVKDGDKWYIREYEWQTLAVSESYLVVEDILTNNYPYIYDPKENIFKVKGEGVSLDGLSCWSVDKVENGVSYIGYKPLFLPNTELYLPTLFGGVIDDLSSADENTKGYYCDGNKIYFLKPYKVYHCDVISGETESKLDDFIDEVRAYDDLGNSLEGVLFRTSDNDNINQQPFENEWLDIPFHSGTTLSRLSLIKEERGLKYWWGDILDDITVCLKDLNGNVVVEVKTDNTKCITEIVDRLYQKFDEMDGVDTDGNTYIIFTYYMGAILRTDSDKYLSIYGKTSENKGVKYVEECTLEEDSANYYITDEDFYPINFYHIKRNEKTIRNYIYNIDETVNVSYFETHINAYDESKIDNLENAKGKYYAYDNGFNSLPLVKREHEVGISSNENIKADIYIHRGIHVAMDKQLKLLEIKTLDDLVKYGNGSFNIKSN